MLVRNIYRKRAVNVYINLL
ncbi:Protein of unknown function [Lactobacillus acidophilus DSM 9126]|nr:Protein of unknown function [Lactobacillus acidophilus DSM 20079 = JCM 1132 = NBRC 13951 = CIP 76.13]CDF69541.1 Protein of unknown function [Lactobacillus acidophilus CIRM-BIA 442]CDF71337.1 Protein of unknown function [Lactobacillus acidophilus CIRM-BIA 445]CDF73167.1 Protein of unknown function [Lactobacillus acidophilus DSM 9126]CDF75156.1 Protein of unknown function [Lactobacillus acidophilus DSM 20242]